MKVGGLQRFSLIDYPGKISCVIFTIGCNFRCPFCHNKELVEGTAEEIPEEEVLSFLEERVGKLDGVVITGGEPTVQKDLPDFLEKIKGMGYPVKLDTNGSNPEMLRKLVEDGTVDYVAMDIKSSPERYSEAAGVEVDMAKIRESTDIIRELEEYEFRTTAVPRLVDGKYMKGVGKLVEGAKKFSIQQFKPGNTLDESYSEMQPFDEEKLKEFKEEVLEFVEKCEIKNL